MSLLAIFFSRQRRNDILTSGAGIAGLTFCVALGKQSNIKMDLYEAAHQFGEIGAGVGMWYRTRQIMEKLGLQEDLTALEDKVDSGKQILVLLQTSSLI